MIACKECGAECSAMNALGYHLRTHGMTYEDYVIKHEHGGNRPLCLTCKTPLQIKKGGFSTFCSKRCASTGEHNAMGRMKGELSPNFGKVRTAAQRKNYSRGSKLRWKLHGQKLREMMKSPEYRDAQSESQRNSWKTSPTRRDQTSVKGQVDANVTLKRDALDRWAEINGYETVFIDYRT